MFVSIDIVRERRGPTLFTGILALLLLASNASVWAGTNVWTSNGPYGGNIQALAVDPLTPSTLYAGTWGGVFKSTDSGASWASASTGITNYDIFALAVDPLTPSTLYAGTWGGVFKSTDSGASWASASTGITSTSILALAVDPVTPSTLYAGTNGGVFKSTNGGASWASASTGLTSTQIRALAVDPLTPSTLYAGAYGGVFKSTDSGASWASASTGLTSTYILALAVDPVTPSTLYAGTDGDIFKSTDSGASWAPASTGITGTYHYALAVDPVTPSTLYAGNPYYGVFKSTNGGASWASASTGLTSNYIYALAVDPLTPSTLYAGTLEDCGVFKSTNGGASWASASTGLTSTYILALAVDPVTPSTLYAGNLYRGVFKSTNGGASWASASTGITSTSILALAVDPVTPSTLYAGTRGGGVFKSPDSGASWVPASAGITNSVINALAVDPVTPSTLYAGTNGGVFKSTNGGASWAGANTGLTNYDIFALAVDPLTPSTFYAGTWGGGVFKSTNGGASWASASTGLTSTQIRALAVDPLTPSTLYAGTYGGVFKSTDSGASWASASTGLTSTYILALAVDPLTPSTLYAGTNGGVFKSTNGGASWAGASTGITSTSILALAVDPLTPSTLYAGAAVGGVSSLTQVAPLVTALSPNQVCTGGGSAVTLMGSYFTGATEVLFGATPATSFTVISDTQITAGIPGHAAGTVDITVVTPYGTSATGPQSQFTYLAVPVPIISGASEGCEGTPVTLTTGSFTAYQWYQDGSPIAGATGQNYDVSATGWYFVSVTNAYGCIGESGWSYILVHPAPQPKLNETRVFYEPFETWQPDGSLPGWTITPDASGMRWFQGSTGYFGNWYGGGDFATIDTSNNPLPGTSSLVSPPFDLNPDVVTAKLQFKTAFYDYYGTQDSYLDISTDGGNGWAHLRTFHDYHCMTPTLGPQEVDLSAYIGQSGLKLRFLANSPEAYTVWQVDDLEIIGVGAIASNGCAANGVSLYTRPYSTYQWTLNGADIPGAISQTYTAMSSGTYAVRVTDGFGCPGTSPGQNITIHPNPAPTITGAAAACQNPGTILNTEMWDSYQWRKNGTPISGATARTHLVTETATYTVQVSDGYSCSGTSAGFSFTAWANPVPTITGPSPACQSGVLSTGSYSTYQWYRNGNIISGATGQSYNAPAPGTYTVHVTDSHGCSAVSAGFMVSSNPTPSISGLSQGCASVTLSTGSFASYQWSLNGSPIAGATGPTYMATQSGTYTVSVVTLAGCSGTSAGKNVTILGTPTPTVAGESFNICPATSVTLTSSPASAYQWAFGGVPILGATSSTYEALVSGDYGVIVTDGNGCQGPSSPHTVFVDFCPSSEVSPKRAVFPARLVKNAASSTGYYLYFQRLDTLDGYNVYEGNVGTYYSHGNAPGNLCNATVTDLGTGQMRAEITPRTGNHYYLITAYGGSDEGPSGFDSANSEISPVQSTCY